MFGNPALNGACDKHERGTAVGSWMGVEKDAGDEGEVGLYNETAPCNEAVAKDILLGFLIIQYIIIRKQLQFELWRYRYHIHEFYKCRHWKNVVILGRFW